jgi:DNA replication and repair protein RecF
MFHFNGNVTCITGPNGSGKTNLLDAVYYLCYTKSYFTNFLQQCSQYGHDGFRITGVFESGTMSETISGKWKGGKKEWTAADVPYDKITDHIGKYAAVIIAPDDIELINGSGEWRRKWIDGILCQSDKDYMNNLLTYVKILAQRNAWLKMNAVAPLGAAPELDYYNIRLSQTGTVIHQKRTVFFTAFQPVLKQLYRTLCNNTEIPELEYNSHLTEKSLLAWLENGLEQDFLYRRTLRGIHRDDMDLVLDNNNLKLFGSQGQKKSFLFALKLAQYTYLHAVMGKKPMLLLDDVFEKLDQTRIEALLNIISDQQFGQVILTDTHAERIKDAFGTSSGIEFISLSK